ncbi:MAG: hypothetical protein DYG92_05710 [Leptolyngbya sp. PLA1]|nr:hypothetical protein [Leptolyngbya sp. PLA1]
MGIQPGSKNSSLRVPQPKAAPAAPPSANMQNLLKTAQKLPGQVKAMSAAVKPPAAPPKPAASPTQAASAPKPAANPAKK